MTRIPTAAIFAALTLALVLLALARPIDHDESQYVAAAVLAAHRLLPYRDFAYLQTPLQPLVLAPLVAVLADWTWPGLRIVNALFAALATAFVYGGARVDAGRRPALAAAGLFAACDILLFAAGTARNDALPAALFAGAVWLIVRQERAPHDRRALAIGVLLGAAAAAKLSYLLPALAYAAAALIDGRRRPAAVLAGALPALALLGWFYHLAPANMWFDVWTFPTAAPAQFYADDPWKLSLAAKLVDTVKFLALGPALLAAIVVAARRRPTLLEALAVAGLVAALLPWPTWRQYLLPVLPPLFVRLAQIWEETPPTRPLRIAAAVFAAAGLAPSVAALAGGTPGMVEAARQSAAIRTALETAKVFGPVATLSPQFLAASGRLPDPRFVTGPFYFRSRDLLSPPAEAMTGLVSAPRMATGLAVRPEGVLTGGEGAWTSGDDALDVKLDDWARDHGYRAMPVEGGRFRLWTRPADASAGIRPR